MKKQTVDSAGFRFLFFVVSAIIVVLACSCEKKERGSILVPVETDFEQEHKLYTMSVWRQGTPYNLQDVREPGSTLYRFFRSDSMVVSVGRENYVDYKITIDGKVRQAIRISARECDSLMVLNIQMSQFF